MSTGIMFRTAIETKRKNSTKLQFLDPNNHFGGILSLLEPFAWHSHVLGAGISQLFQRLDDSGVAIVGSSPISIQNGHWETGCPSGVPTDDRKSFQIPYLWNKIHYLVLYVGHANKDWPTSGIKHCGWRSPDTARYRRLVPESFHKSAYAVCIESRDSKENTPVLIISFLFFQRLSKTLELWNQIFQADCL